MAKIQQQEISGGGSVTRFEVITDLWKDFNRWKIQTDPLPSLSGAGGRDWSRLRKLESRRVNLRKLMSLRDCATQGPLRKVGGQTFHHVSPHPTGRSVWSQEKAGKEGFYGRVAVNLHFGKICRPFPLPTNLNAESPDGLGAIPEKGKD
jgi:hypothetical protein